MKKRNLRLIAGGLALWLAASPALAGEAEQLEMVRQTTLNLIKLLVQQKVLTQEAADRLIHQAETSAAAEVAAKHKAAPAENVVRVPYVPEMVRNQIRDQIKQEVLAQAKAERWGDPGALPSWLDRFDWYGDIRLRYQRDIYPSGNASPIYFQSAGQTSVTDTTENRDRLRLRARLGVKAKVTDGISAGIRLTTGNTSTPVSTNQTLGNTFNKYETVFDLAYLKLDPYAWLTVEGGRIPNPYFHTSLVWATDLGFEGIAASVKPRFREDLSGFFTAGAFPLQSIAVSDTVLADDKWLFGYQAGLEWRSPDTSEAKVGLALYDYRNVQGRQNPNLGSHVYDATAPQYTQKGNSLMFINYPGDPTLYGLASKFRELNLTGGYDFGMYDPIHVVVTGDYVKNIGFDQAEIFSRTGQQIVPKTLGYMAKVSVGMPKIERFRDWQVYLAYKYLERDAVLDAFTDSDFHLGGTDAKGYILGGSYGIDKHAWLGLKWLSADQISGLPLSIDVLQVDLGAKF